MIELKACIFVIFLLKLSSPKVVDAVICHPLRGCWECCPLSASPEICPPLGTATLRTGGVGRRKSSQPCLPGVSRGLHDTALQFHFPFPSPASVLPPSHRCGSREHSLTNISHTDLISKPTPREPSLQLSTNPFLFINSNMISNFQLPGFSSVTKVSMWWGVPGAIC